MDKKEEKIARRLPLLWAALVASVAKAQSVIITPGATTFGPPRPLNGECPNCHTMHPPFRPDTEPLETPGETWDWINGKWSRMVRCVFCRVSFWQDQEPS